MKTDDFTQLSFDTVNGQDAENLRSNIQLEQEALDEVLNDTSPFTQNRPKMAYFKPKNYKNQLKSQ